MSKFGHTNNTDIDDDRGMHKGRSCGAAEEEVARPEARHASLGRGLGLGVVAGAGGHGVETPLETGRAGDANQPGAQNARRGLQLVRLGLGVPRDLRWKTSRRMCIELGG